ncbi:hypothetical protein MA16_Dca024771 [Dendrobium catenatum]|uniref:Kinesin motor domain-containing protein n=1 Tax=Dendrobium catenatum TaxID=906689 RepID=A0A2I0XAI6_9ASPA|nr:hypothetical protein MA16_Dca024771 [Dendrobium catenatum]
MAYRAVPRQKRLVTTAKAGNSPSSSTTSSSRLVPEVASVDGQSSPASSSAKSKPHSYLESPALDTEVAKENVTVTVRFRPLSDGLSVREVAHERFARGKRLLGMRTGILLLEARIIHQWHTHTVSGVSSNNIKVYYSLYSYGSAIPSVPCSFWRKLVVGLVDMLYSLPGNLYNA